MAADHLHFTWWLDADGHPWVEHDCNGETLTWRVPPPWRYDESTGGLTPSFDCKRCGRHTFLHAVDRRERLTKRGEA